MARQIITIQHQTANFASEERIVLCHLETARPACGLARSVRQTMVQLDIEPVKHTFFSAEGERCVLSGVVSASVTVTPVRLSHRQKTHCRRHVGHGLRHHCRRAAPCHPGWPQTDAHAGDGIFLGGAERSTIVSCNRAKFTKISIPMDDLTSTLAS